MRPTATRGRGRYPWRPSGEEGRMLARRELPDEYRRWNDRWGVPFGRHRLPVQLLERSGALGRVALARPALRRWSGPFAFQWNTRTRTYEYPWVRGQLVRAGARRVLEIGGALSGLQFALAADGMSVCNVDPFLDYGSGAYEIDPAAEHAMLNRVFGTTVELCRTTLPEARPTGPFDAAVCVSTLEHLRPADIEETLAVVRDVVVPGGIVVLTVDLFLDLDPFTDVEENRWGRNVPVAWIEELLGGELVVGDRTELLGYPEFDVRHVLTELGSLTMGSEYPQLAQLAVVRCP